jgi:hypothetical protein
LPRPVLRIPEHDCGSVGVVPEQEHQPWQTQRFGCGVLEFRVGHRGLVADRRPVAKAHYQHKDIGVSDRFSAELGWLLVDR